MILLLIKAFSFKMIAKPSELHSLFSPALDENGRSHRFSFHNDYIVKTYASDSTYVQLGYFGPNSAAGIISKNPISFANFRIDFTIEIHPAETPGIGMAFWLTKDETFRGGNAYGREENFNGLLLVIDTQGKAPFIGLTIGKAQYHKNMFPNVVNLRKEFYGAPVTIRVENISNELKVYLSVKDDDFKEIFKVQNSGLGEGFYHAISGANGIGMNMNVIHAINVEELEFTMVEDKVERKSGWFIWIVCFGALLSIGYLLYTKQFSGGAKRNTA
ncbi:hypothetical protein COBT_001562 [Conglomerata obtusa]